MANNKITTIDEAIQQASRRFSGVRTDKELKFAQEKLHVLSLLKRTPKLRECTPESIYDAMLQAASMGLTLNPTVGHCYIIPRKMRKKKDGESWDKYKEVPSFAYASPSYRGLIHIPVASGAVRFARAEVVFKNDEFGYLGPHHDVEYRLNTSHDQQIENNAVEVFAVAKTSHGDHLSEHMPREIVQRIRNMSEMPNSIMWHPDKLWTEGWKKAVLRRLYKTLPNAPVALATAMEVLNQYEGLDPANLKKQELTGSTAPEALVLLNNDQINSLYAAFTDAGKEEAYTTRQLGRLAKTYGLNEIASLPAAKFDEALEKITTGLKS